MERRCLESCDIMILSSLTSVPSANPDTMLGELCTRLGKITAAFNYYYIFVLYQLLQLEMVEIY